MIESINTMTKKINEMVTDSEFIQQMCQDLQAGIKKQASGIKRIATHGDATAIASMDMWDKIEKQLDKIDKSIKKFHENCDETVEYIGNAQRRTAGVSK